MNVDPKNLFISKSTPYLPMHKLMDMALEHQKGERKLINVKSWTNLYRQTAGGFKSAGSVYSKLVQKYKN